MKRRNFIRQAAALSLPLIGGFPGLRAAGSSRLAELISSDSDRVLVLIHLNGGNDGLNTLVPLNQLSELQAVRPNIVQPEQSLHNLTDNLALHSRMAGMSQLFAQGKMGIVQDVGYPNQNRSHFRSTDIWTTGSDATTVLDTGWAARHLDQDFPSFPGDYPTATRPHPPAITLSTTAHATCQGVVTNMSQTVRDPFSVTYLAPGGNAPTSDDLYGTQLDFLRTSIDQTNEYASVIQGAANAGSSTANYPGSDLSNQLQNVVRLVSGGLRTQVYVVQLHGFDTHASQVASDVTGGTHADLLGDLSANILAFQQDLEAQGIADRVLGMTFSEFGRRIRSNASAGTDHGTAAPMFVFGNCTGGTVIGDNTQIDPDVGQEVGVPMQYDFRDVYGSVLMDWFDVPETEVRSQLYPGFVYLPVANACGRSLPVQMLNWSATPVKDRIDLRWSTTDEIQNKGFEIERSLDGRNFRTIGYRSASAPGAHGVHEYKLEDGDVRIGPLYYYRLKQLDFGGTFTYSTVRTARLNGSAVGQWSVNDPYPNPAVDEARVPIFAPVDSNIAYTLHDVNGRLAQKNSAQLIGRRDSELLIDCRRLQTGVYTLRIRPENGEVISKKILVR